MAIQPTSYITNSQAANNAITTTATKTAGVSVDKDAFLKIMISQLKYQDPMNPMQADQFLSQLAQMTQVEQLTNMTKSLEAIQKAQETGNITQWISTIGKRMNVDTNILSQGDEVYLAPKSDYDKVVLTLKGEDGGLREVTINKGEALAYRHNEASKVTFAATALKDNKQVECATSAYRLVKGVELGTGGLVLMTGSGDGYSIDKVKLIKE